MKNPLCILYLEDDPADAELIKERLESDGIASQITRVETEADFLSALERGGFDIIFADYTLPCFDGLSALKIARKGWPDLPFLFVSGTLNEDVAIEALKVGATDYVFKTRLARIVPSVVRALREAEERSGLRQTAVALLRSETYLAEAQRLSHTGSFGWDVLSGEVSWSRETFRIFEYDPALKVTIDSVVQRAHPEDRPALLQFIDRVSRERIEFDFEHRLLLPSGSVKHIHVVGHPSTNESRGFEFVGAVTDITERRRAEEALRRSEGYLAEAQRLTRSGSWAWNVRTEETFWSREMFRILGYDPEITEPALSSFLARIHPEDRPLMEQKAKIESTQLGGIDSVADYRIVLTNGRIKYVHSVAHPVMNESGEVGEVIGTTMDVTEQHEARTALETALAEIAALKDRLYKENIALREEVDKASMFEEIVGGSGALQAVLARVAKVAPTDSTVLITGETGTGKELVARAIHKRSQRSSRGFVSVSCAAIPPSLIASELFGHERGAFTGALQRRLGRFEMAEGGTIFLDEIGELPAETQIALLRVLQEREFERIGGSHPICADVRVIAATNRDLESAIAAGTFRSDLFYRLNVFPIVLPPLRERKEDIPTLVEYFLHRYSRKAGKKIGNIEKRTLELLESYSWPGNIRELQNVIERSVIVYERDPFSVDPSWLSLKSLPAQAGESPFAKHSPAQERDAIETALAATGGRVSGPAGAAAHLGLPASTLESRIRALKINKYRFKSV
jgi:PAS domain S-box-containing protein